MSVSVASAVKFYDGKTSKVHIVDVVFSGSILHITDSTGNNLASWSIATIKVLEPPSPPVPGVISSDTMPDARLHIEDGKGWAYIKSRIPKHNKKLWLLPTHWSSFFGYGLVSVLSLAFLFIMFPRVLGNLAHFMPASWEKALGQHVMKTMVGSDKTCSAPAGQKVLNDMTRKIQGQMTRDVKYDVRVINNSYMLNAFAAPGGHIIIYKKIIDDAGSPEELVGILAHEMAHVELRHASKSVIRNLGLGYTLSAIFGNVGSLESAASLLSQMSYSREDERSADAHAKKTLNALNINPRGLQEFLERVAEMEPDIDIKGIEFLSYLSSHPDTRERIKALEQDQTQRYTAPMSEREWNAVRSICDETKPTTYE